MRLVPMNLMSTSWFCLLLVAAPCVVGCGGGNDPSPSKSNEWDGHTYSLSIGDRSWTEPRGVINDIKDYVPEFFFEVHGDSATSFDVTTATAHSDVQDPCTVTGSLPGAANAIGPGDFPLRIKHLREDIVVQATLHDLTFVDALPTAGVVSTTGKFSATLDARDVAPLFTQIDSDPTADDLCSTLGQLSPPVACEACPQDGEAYCLTLKAEKIGATDSDGTTIEPITEPTDPSCN
jgi:hypothetical protein